MIGEFEGDLRRGSAPTAARILAGLNTIPWEVARMDEALRLASPGVVTGDDTKAFKGALRRIERESESLTSWLRACVLEIPRN